jgi:hypothetical protein
MRAMKGPRVVPVTRTAQAGSVLLVVDVLSRSRLADLTREIGQPRPAGPRR